MAKIRRWTPEQAQKELAKRLKYSKEQRTRLEYEWDNNEATVMNAAGEINRVSMNVDWNTGAVVEEADSSDSDIGVNYAFKNFRFIHSQLCANPPTVIPRPTSSDLSDRRKADAADRLIRYAMRNYKLPEVFAQSSYFALLYGSSFIKTMWDTDAGEPIDFDEQTEELTMEGDVCFKAVSPKSIFLDPDATRWSEVKYVIERILMPYEEACYRFPDKVEELEKSRKAQSAYNQEEMPTSYDSAFKTTPYDVV